MLDALRAALTGSVVALEPLSRKHVEGLCRAGADPAIWRWMSVTSIDEWLPAALSEPGRVPFAVVRDGTVVGSSSYLEVTPEHRRVEIGHTWFAPAAWGTGANVETKLLMLRHAFEAVGCLRVEFKTDASNQRSRSALEALPAVFEGIHRRHMLVRGGARRDSAWYSVIDEDWPRVRENLEHRLARRPGQSQRPRSAISPEASSSRQHR